MSFKNSTAERTTVTRDAVVFEEKTDNIYEALVIMGKRANQVSVELKEELMSKLAEFATTQDSLEEVYENREQIEISRFYERLPKPPAIALQEMEEDKIYHRQPETDTAKIEE